MKKILILSDTHGRNDVMRQIIKKEKPFNMLIHCGDLEDTPSMLEAMVDCPVHAVSGNNDYNADLPRTDIFRIGRLKVLLVHGHRYGLYNGLSSLYYFARENEADIVMFGHTHHPLVTVEGGVTFVNPGSVTYPRQEGHRPSYIIMNVDDAGEATFEKRFWGADNT